MYKLSLITPEKIIFEQDVYSLVAPGVDGYLEILTNHAPIVVLLTVGKLTITTEDKKRFVYAVEDGFLEFKNNKASILSQSIEAAETIDLTRAQEARERAEIRLEHPDDKTNLEQAKKALKRAQNRIAIYEEFQSTRH